MKRKTTFVPGDFLTRAEKIEQITIPLSTDNKIIVTPNNEGLGFRKNCYNQEQLANKVEKKKFDLTIIQANKICETVWKNKKMEEEAEYSKSLKTVLYVAIFFSILSFVLLIILVYGDGTDSLLWASISLICIAGTLILIVVIKSLFTEPKFIDLEKTIMDQLNIFFDKENNNFYSKNGLLWEVQEKFYWLTLHIK
ncbi:hypothetical protein IMG5_177170 [Ichthyophthirius multifiliis]|uniref:Uncharacterized protein n=1 Tax=Ichthyophthirius multifiliis TaxID=5932 RepID=G0R2D4_ICHMU|nr:hypothetical protein IMG5_177170 [Ichthyophthirius multifiliis]EGR28370.1 hypothetical protein IMG5_177170 [Ichthyophthirius multifiliis]|eukprot:XP_004027715.1 hypothetical protein IMG5_177170 [Ichthyophthirius multifiliis]